MNVYIFSRVRKVSNLYHEGGGLVVIARDIEQVAQLVKSTNGVVRLDEDEIKDVITYPLEGEHEAKIFSFPDNGED
jgi:uncharacterized membrane protein YvbJ